jgi:hypothetical protein
MGRAVTLAERASPNPAPPGRRLRPPGHPEGPEDLAAWPPREELTRRRGTKGDLTSEFGS